MGFRVSIVSKSGNHPKQGTRLGVSINTNVQARWQQHRRLLHLSPLWAALLVPKHNLQILHALFLCACTASSKRLLHDGSFSFLDL